MTNKDELIKLVLARRNKKDFMYNDLLHGLSDLEGVCLTGNGVISIVGEKNIIYIDRKVYDKKENKWYRLGTIRRIEIYEDGGASIISPCERTEGNSFRVHTDYKEIIRRVLNILVPYVDSDYYKYEKGK